MAGQASTLRAQRPNSRLVGGLRALPRQRRVGGPADLRDLADLQILKIAVGPMDNNAYVLRSPVNGRDVAH